MPTRRDFHKLSIAAAMAALPGVGLGQSAAVAAFAQASGPQGGAGALIVLLKG